MSTQTSTTATNKSHPSPSTTLTTETSLSLLYRVLRTVIRPFRPRLVTPGKPQPAGSPRLTDYPKTKNGCRIVERQDSGTGLWLYDFVPTSRMSPTGSSTSREEAKSHHVLYFAGGGFQSPPASEHWSFVSSLASDPRVSSIYDFTVVSYPLAPNSPACDSLLVLRRYLSSVCKRASQLGAKVTLMGDSAGGNVALSLGLWWADESSQDVPAGKPIDSSTTNDQKSHDDCGDGDDDTTIAAGEISNNANNDDYAGGSKASQAAGKTNYSVLTDIIVISPAADLRNTNPSIKQADLHDPVLSMALIEQTAAAWTQSSTSTSTGPSSRSDPYLSPVMTSVATLQRLKAIGIKIHGAIGTHDVLAPDAEVFHQKCIECDVPGDWLVWEGQMHCFVLAGVYGMKEGKQGIRWIVDVLSRNA